MGRASIAIRGTNCCPGVLDGPVARQSLSNRKPTPGFCISVGRTGQALSGTPRTFTSPRSDEPSEGPQEEVVLQQLWFRLSDEDRARFGGCFSRMVLRALERQTSQEGGNEP
jgi:hypothetical protein